MAKVNLAAGKLLPQLDNERPNDPIEISIDDLSLKVLGENRADYLWEIGSASNWLSYHIALFLGFHQYFINLEQSPIPSLLIFDQPSQAYFPKNMTLSEREEDDFKYKDEDYIAVQKIFSSIVSVIKHLNKQLQVIVLDHAADEIWGMMKVNALDWRKEKLIPDSWSSTDNQNS